MLHRSQFLFTLDAERMAVVLTLFPERFRVLLPSSSHLSEVFAFLRKVYRFPLGFVPRSVQSLQITGVLVFLFRLPFILPGSTTSVFFAGKFEAATLGWGPAVMLFSKQTRWYCICSGMHVAPR